MVNFMRNNSLSRITPLVAIPPLGIWMYCHCNSFPLLEIEGRFCMLEYRYGSIEIVRSEMNPRV